MRIVGLTLTTLVLTALVSYSGGDLKEKDKGLTTKGLEGTYRLVSSENSGEPVPDKENEGAMVRFTKDRIMATDRDRKETYAATYKLDASKTPAVIHMMSLLPKKGMPAKGIVEIKGDTVRLIYSFDEGKAPTEFKTQKGQIMVVLERVRE